jgi:membrane protein required for colicin V production
MTGLDWFILAVIGLSILLAAAQGFFFEACSLGGAILGYVLAAWGYGIAAPWFEPYVKSPAIANAAGFLVIFAAVMIIAGIAGRVARWAMKEVGMGWVDRLLGASFGLIRGVLVVSVVLLALTAFAPESKSLENSSLSRYFLVSGKVASWLAPSEMQQKFQEGIALLRKNRMEALAPAHKQADAKDLNRKDKSATEAKPAQQ